MESLGISQFSVISLNYSQLSASSTLFFSSIITKWNIRSSFSRKKNCFHTEKMKFITDLHVLPVRHLRSEWKFSGQCKLVFLEDRICLDGNNTNHAKENRSVDFVAKNTILLNFLLGFTKQTFVVHWCLRVGLTLNMAANRWLKRIANRKMKLLFLTENATP